MISLILFTALFGILVSAFEADGNNNVVVYWGQNSAGGQNTQESLAYYCAYEATDVVVLSFLTTFFGTGGLPEVNFAGSCNGPIFAGSQLLQCDQIATDIKTCQGLGKKVLLSLGGAVGQYGFTDDGQAEQFADQIWNIFGGGTSDTRPFGDSIVDGFDLDIENNNPAGYSAFIDQMRTHYASDSSKSYYISGAPQCPIPDYNLNPALTTSSFDFIFVQFYNNFCGMQNWVGGAPGSNFNFADWDTFVKTQSFNKNAKVYLGVPASPTAAGSGYQPIEVVAEAAQYLQKGYSTFGGIMMWDASQAWTNVDSNGRNFAQGAKAALGGGSPPPPPPVVTTTTSTTTSSSIVTSIIVNPPSPTTSTFIVVPSSIIPSSSAIIPPVSSSVIASSSVISSTPVLTSDAASTASSESTTASTIPLSSSNDLQTSSVLFTSSELISSFLASTTEIGSSFLSASAIPTSSVSSNSLAASSVDSASTILGVSSSTLDESSILSTLEASSVLTSSVIVSATTTPISTPTTTTAQVEPSSNSPQQPSSTPITTTASLITSPSLPFASSTPSSIASPTFVPTTLQTSQAVTTPPPQFHIISTIGPGAPLTPASLPGDVTIYVTTNGVVEEIITHYEPDHYTTVTQTLTTGTTTIVVTALAVAL